MCVQHSRHKYPGPRLTSSSLATSESAACGSGISSDFSIAFATSRGSRSFSGPNTRLSADAISFKASQHGWQRWRRFKDFGNGRNRASHTMQPVLKQSQVSPEHANALPGAFVRH